ncbi:3'-5' exonuclease [Vibrio sp. D431a]|uniref:3'-5' exonuclease n=1 Tax=Vibrio sp. D431a TaxID=2837388 RepID=UPI002553A5E1|nr:3'-5' exonuclease [Vibrio sp. D431a]MDK9790116.1 exonuclease domain-containing protein [Vibrio sp. D431a]
MKVVAYDMEMLCWEDRPETGDIIEIAAVIVDLRAGTINKRYSVIIKPDEGEVSKFCQNLTGITQRMVNKQGVSLEEGVRRLYKQISPKHNWYAWGKDAEKLVAECNKRGIAINASSLHNIAPIVRMMYQESFNLKQSDVCEHQGVEVKKPMHRALPDAESLAGILIKIFGGEPIFRLPLSENSKNRIL